MFGFKKRRRRGIRSQPFPRDWLGFLERGVPYYRRLPPADQEELRGHVQVLIAEKNFEGCGGLDITDEIRVIVAGHAGIYCSTAPPTTTPVSTPSSCTHTPLSPRPPSNASVP